MAAAAVTAHRRNSDVAPELKANIYALTNKYLPDEKDRLSDFFVQMLMLDGIWRDRRIVWNHEVLFITRQDSPVVVDNIPLHEIETISIMTESSFPFHHNSFESTPSGNSVASGSAEHSNLEFFVTSTATHLFNIRTTINGINSGRTYYFSTRQLENPDHARHSIANLLTKCSAMAKRKIDVKSKWQRSQDKVRVVYQSLPFQAFMALLIIANFIANAAQAQLIDLITDSNGSSTVLGASFDQMDIFFTSIFTAELLVNAYANWFRSFINDGWSVFDALVVALSLLALGPVPMPANVLRSTRAFRVVRIFGRLGSLRDIVDALTSGIIPHFLPEAQFFSAFLVLNALLILFVVMSIYAIVGVYFFKDRYPLHFDRFDMAFATLFSLASGLDGLMTNMPDLLEGGAPTALCYFVGTFVVVVNWTLLQICVAVLLDSFLTARSRQNHERETFCSENTNAHHIVDFASLVDMKESRMHADLNTFRSALDPLLQTLSQDYVDGEDLTRRIHKLFEILDADDSNGLTCMEFRTGIRKLNFDPPIHVSDEDFAVVSNNGELLDESGQLGLVAFEAVMRSQIRLYIQRQMSNTLIAGANSRFEIAQLSSMKAIHHDIAKLQDVQSSSLSMQRRIADEMTTLQKDLSSLRQHLIADVFPSLPPTPSAAGAAAAAPIVLNSRARAALMAVLSWRRPTAPSSAPERTLISTLSWGPPPRSPSNAGPAPPPPPQRSSAAATAWATAAALAAAVAARCWPQRAAQHRPPSDGAPLVVAATGFAAAPASAPATMNPEGVGLGMERGDILSAGFDAAGRPRSGRTNAARARRQSAAQCEGISAAQLDGPTPPPLSRRNPRAAAASSRRLVAAAAEIHPRQEVWRSLPAPPILAPAVGGAAASAVSAPPGTCVTPAVVGALPVQGGQHDDSVVAFAGGTGGGGSASAQRFSVARDEGGQFAVALVGPPDDGTFAEVPGVDATPPGHDHRASTSARGWRPPTIFQEDTVQDAQSAAAAAAAAAPRPGPPIAASFHADPSPPSAHTLSAVSAAVGFLGERAEVSATPAAPTSSAAAVATMATVALDCNPVPAPPAPSAVSTHMSAPRPAAASAEAVIAAAAPCAVTAISSSVAAAGASPPTGRASPQRPASSDRADVAAALEAETRAVRGAFSAAPRRQEAQLLAPPLRADSAARAAVPPLRDGSEMVFVHGMRGPPWMAAVAVVSDRP